MDKNFEHPPIKFGKTGALIVNLGTPDSTSWFDIRKYLKEFLSDKRVIEVFLTDKGEDLQRQIEKHIENVGFEIEKQIEPIDRNDVIESLSILNWALLKTKLK